MGIVCSSLRAPAIILINSIAYKLCISLCQVGFRRNNFITVTIIPYRIHVFIGRRVWKVYVCNLQ